MKKKYIINHILDIFTFLLVYLILQDILIYT